MNVSMLTGCNESGGTNQVSHGGGEDVLPGESEAVSVSLRIPLALHLQEPDARTDATGCPEVKTVDGYQGREKEVSWRKELKIQVQSSTLIAG